MRHIKFINSILLIFCFAFSSCSQSTENRNVEFFKGTKAYSLAKAVYDSDLKKIEELVRKDSTLLSVTNPISGSNVLSLSIHIEKYDALKKLLELGGNPNSVNSLTKYSLLIESIRPFGTQFEWRREHQYAKLLLEYGADPNYSIEEEFERKKGHFVMPTSPLREASSFDLDAVKLLIKYGADPYHKIKQDQSTPFSMAAQSGKIDIINYFIDSLKVDIHQPMRTVVRKPDNDTVTYYIQDYLVNKFTRAKIENDTSKLKSLKKENPNIEEANKELWKLIVRLQDLGVDFKNYEYK